MFSIAIHEISSGGGLKNLMDLQAVLFRQYHLEDGGTLALRNVGIQHHYTVS
jgi:hypothetical protein